MFVTDDLVLQLLAAALADVDQGELAEVIRVGPARCATGWRPADTWYRTDSPTRRKSGSRTALQVCRRCEVAVPCGLLATARREQWGTWGAMTEPHRRLLLRLLDQITGSRPVLPPIRPTAAEPSRVRQRPRRQASATPARPAP